MIWRVRSQDFSKCSEVSPVSAELPSIVAILHSNRALCTMHSSSWRLETKISSNVINFVEPFSCDHSSELWRSLSSKLRKADDSKSLLGQSNCFPRYYNVIAGEKENPKWLFVFVILYIYNVYFHLLSSKLKTSIHQDQVHYFLWPPSCCLTSCREIFLTSKQKGDKACHIDMCLHVHASQPCYRQCRELETMFTLMSCTSINQ